MEKLIELLCEYLGEEYHGEYFEWYRDIEIPQRLDSLSELKPFIKWLVENDKIDLVKVYKNLNDYEIEIRIRAVKELLEDNEEDTIAYLKLLMLLAIQDEPIRFLCEIIK